MQTKTQNYVKRYLMLCVGLTIISFGIAFSIKAGLGTTPVSSLPYILSEITPLSVGSATTVMHCGMILLQILLLRREYELIQLVQLPVALLFGVLTDFSVWAIQGISCSSYGAQWLLCAVGILLVGIGVSLEVAANVVTLAGEGAVLAICKVFSLPFAKTKVSFDMALVLSASILAVIFLGYLAGVREGTVAAAIFVGLTVKQVSKPVARFAEKYLRS